MPTINNLQPKRDVHLPLHSSPDLDLGPPLPVPVTNNAVAAWSHGARTTVYSFLRLDSTKAWNGVTNRAFEWTIWRHLPSSLATPSMDHRAMLLAGDRLVIVGGMVGDQIVANQVVTALVSEAVGRAQPSPLSPLPSPLVSHLPYPRHQFHH